MKKRSGKNLLRFFYHFLVVLVMAMPMLSGLVRVIYVQSNQNAYENYGFVDEYEILNTYYDTNEVNSIDDLVIGNVYTLTFVAGGSYDSYHILVNEFYTISMTNFSVGQGSLLDSYPYLRVTSLYLLIPISKVNDSTLERYSCQSATVDFVLRDIGDIPNVDFISSCPREYIKQTEVVEYRSTLDNAFDYSLRKTLEDFTFHSDFSFTDIANGMLMTFDNNNLYIQYINFYINWVLTCAVISFAPYVLLTFYHLAIGLLDKFMKKGDYL